MLTVTPNAGEQEASGKAPGGVPDRSPLSALAASTAAPSAPMAPPNAWDTMDSVNHRRRPMSALHPSVAAGGIRARSVRMAQPCAGAPMRTP